MKKHFWVLALVLAGLALGYQWGKLDSVSLNNGNTSVRLPSEYQYVSPLLLCSSSGGSASSRNEELQEAVADIITETDVQASVYYRDLIEGTWLGVNENEVYAPSSMLKVPLAIAYFKIRENQSDLFEHQIYVEEGGTDFNAVEHFKPEESAQMGSTYTISQLLHFMLKYSDNNSKMLLDLLLSEDIKQDVYSDLGLSFPFGPGNDADFMSVQDFARFFRVLFNGTYLTPDSSDELLSWLTQARFAYGIAATIPDQIPVAEKFGENVVLGDGVSNNELHDCGIVYYPEHPYLLCVMTKGAASFDDLSLLIQKISNLVYQKTDEKFGEVE
jgi:beta-lactamase class A